MTGKWARNLTGTPSGIFRTTNGSADKLIAIGRTIKAGYITSRVGVPNARYDAIVDLGNGKLLRIQIKGVGENGVASFTGGGRSGKQISRDVPQQIYKYTKSDCDIIMIIESDNGDCYIIPVEDIAEWGNTKPLKELQDYKENWKIFSNYTR